VKNSPLYGGEFCISTYGIDVASFRKTVYLPNSFFVDGSAQQTIDAMTNRTTNYAPGSAKQVLDALANTPNETVEKTKHTKQKRDQPSPRRGFFLGRALERGRTGSNRAYVSAPNT
jgi:hypothetical protein